MHNIILFILSMHLRSVISDFCSCIFSVLHFPPLSSCFGPPFSSLASSVDPDRSGALFTKGRKQLSHVRRSQTVSATSQAIHETRRWCDDRKCGRKLSQTIAKFATYLSQSQIRVYKYIKRLYFFILSTFLQIIVSQCVNSCYLIFTSEGTSSMTQFVS